MSTSRLLAQIALLLFAGQLEGKIRDTEALRTVLLDKAEIADLGFSIDLYGRSFSQVWVNANGTLTFDGPSATSCEPLSQVRNATIAPACRENAGVQTVHYGRITIDGHAAFAASWNSRGAADQFQVVLIDRNGAFDIEFNYGSPETSAIRAGFTNGTGRRGTLLEFPPQLKRRLAQSRLTFTIRPSGAVGAQASDITGAITEYSLPRSVSAPMEIVAGPDGALWFTEGEGSIGRITTAGMITEYPIPTSGGNPYSITVGPGGLWFTEQVSGNIGQITTAGAITEFPGFDMPQGITTGPDGALWVANADYFSNTSIFKTGSPGLTIASSSLMNTPNGITTAADGSIWFTEFGPTVGKVNANGLVTEYATSNPNLEAQYITPGPDGALWFTAGNPVFQEIGRITTQGALTEYPLSSGDAFDITTGPDGALWFTERTSNAIGRITTSGTITTYPIPTPDAMPWGITKGPDGALWFTEWATGKIGRIAASVASGAPALGISKTHSGSFTQGQVSAMYTVTVTNTGTGATSGTVTVTEAVPSGLTLAGMSGTGWTCGNNTCTRSDALAAGNSYPAISVAVNVAGNATSPQVNQVSVSGGGAASANTIDSTTITTAAALTVSGQVTYLGNGLPGVTILLNGSQSATTTTDSSGRYSFVGVIAGGTYTVTPSLPGYGFSPVNQTLANLSSSVMVPTFSATGVAALQLFTLAPCRVLDTRNANGPLGGPLLAGGTSRLIPVPSSPCNIPANAAAYSLNITVVPRKGTLSYLTVWPAGSSQPVVSTLNSLDGSALANAAIVPAGSQGAINAFATNDTDLIVDVNGYFAPPAANSLQFYPLTPCRVFDTRSSGAIAGGSTRTFSIQSSACAVPASAAAYAFNVTAVPHGPLGYVSAWPTGQSQPLVSTLNSFDGTVLANAAIVPAGNNGQVSFFASDTTDLVVDINGYFAAPSSAGLNFYPSTPCRLLDTRAANSAFGGPPISGGTSRSFPLTNGVCGLPSGSAAFSLNVTAVPAGTLSYLTAWPTGTAQPTVSTLNDPKGLPLANAALLPGGSNGSISIFVTNNSNVVVDTNGYFAH